MEFDSFGNPQALSPYGSYTKGGASLGGDEYDPICFMTEMGIEFDGSERKILHRTLLSAAA